MDEMEGAAAAVLRPSVAMPQDTARVQGIDLSKEGPLSVVQLTESFLTTGFQATNLGRAIQIVKEMVSQYAHIQD